MTVQAKHDPDQAAISGFGLITALLYILLVAAAITPLAVVSRTRVLSSVHANKSTRFELLASGLSKVMYAVHLSSPALPGWQRCETKGKAYYLRIQDQKGLIDLNNASNFLLSIGFQSLGLNAQDAAFFAGRVERYRESGAANDGEDDDPGFVAKRATFENAAELYDVFGPDAPQHSEISDVFTIHNRTDTVTIAHSPKLLLAKLNGDANMAALIDPTSALSAHAEILFAEFDAHEQYGFLSRMMIIPSHREGATQNVVGKQVGFVDLQELRLSDELAPCADPFKMLVEGL